MLTREQEQAIIDAVYARLELRGCMIGYQGDGESRVLHYGVPTSVNYHAAVVVVEEAELTAEEAEELDLSEEQAVRRRQPDVLNNESVVTREAIGAGLNCGAAVLSWAVVAGGAGAAPVTGGVSTVLVVLAWTGAVTSTIQCVNGIVRTVEAIHDPATLREWDESEVYTGIMLFVDGVGVASSVASAGLQARNLVQVLRRYNALGATDDLMALSRNQRSALLRQAVRDIGRTEAGRRALREALADAGVDRANSVMAGHVNRTRNLVNAARAAHQAITRAAARELQAGIRDALRSAATSALDPEFAGSAGGAVHALIVSVMERGDNDGGAGGGDLN